MPERLVFASNAWLDALRSIMVQRAEAANGDLPDGFSMCEVFTDVPAEVNDSSRVAWHCRVADGAFAWELGEVDDVQRKIVADWETILPVARTVFAEDPAKAAEVQQAMAKALAEGKVSVTGGLGPQPTVFAAVHDEIARLTA